MTRRRPSPDALRSQLAGSGAGVLWCHTDNYQPVDELLARIDRTDDPRVRRVIATASKRPRPTTLATDVAAVLGVLPGSTGQDRGEVRIDQLVPLLLEDPVEHLLLGSAWWLHTDCLQELTLATRAAGVALWLLGTDPLTPDDLAALHGLGLKITDAALKEAFADMTGVPTGAISRADADPWASITRLPTSDFVTFLHDVHQQLPKDQAAVVESTLRAENSYAVEWLDHHTPPTLETVALELQSRWNQCVSWTQFLTLVRAWQIAAFHRGWLLKVSPSQLAGTATAVPSARQREDAQWARLGAWHEPCNAAACAFVAAEMGSQEAVDVTLAHVSPDGSTVQLPEREVTIEPAARRYVRAASYSRLLSGAGPQDSLLVTPAGRRPAARWVSLQATNARETFGLPLTSATITGRSTSGDRWASRWGLTLIELT